MLTRGKSPVPGATCSRRVSRRKPRKTSTATPQQRRKETTDRMKGNITILSATTRRLDAQDPCAPSTRMTTFLPRGHCQAICQMIQTSGYDAVAMPEPRDRTRHRRGVSALLPRGEDGDTRRVSYL